MRLAEAFVDIRPEFSSFRGGLLKGLTGELSLGTKLLGGLGLAAGAALVAGSAAAAQFASKLSGVKAVSLATESQMEAVRVKALQLGRDTAFSANDAAGAMEELVKAGLSIEQVLSGAADAAVSLAAAGGVSLVEASTIAANALNAFALGGDQVAKVADIVAGAANASAIDVSDFGLSLAQTGAVANLVGLSLKDTAAAIGLLGNAGIRGSDAGTSLKTFLERLVPITVRESNLFRELGIITEEGGNKFFDAAGKVKSLAGISQVLQDALKNQNREQQLANLTIGFGTDAIRAAGVLAKAGAAGVGEFNAELSRTSAADVARTRLDNLGGSLKQFRGSLDAVLIGIGTPLQTALRSVVDFGTGTLNTFAALGSGSGVVTDTFHLLGQVARDIAQLIGNVAREAAPTVTVLARLGGGAVLLGLRALADVLAPLAHLLASNRVAADLLAGVLVGKLVVALVPLASTIGSVIGTMILFGDLVVTVTGELIAAGIAAVSLGGSLAPLRAVLASLGTSLRSIGTGVGFALVGAAAVTLAQGIANANAQAKELFNTLTSKASTSSSLDVLRAETDKAVASAHQLQTELNSKGPRALQFFVGTIQNIVPGATKTILNLQKGIDASASAALSNAQRFSAVRTAIADITRVTGLSTGQVQALAGALKVDLAGPFSKGSQKVIEAAGKMGKAIEASGGDVVAAKALYGQAQKAAEELATGMAQSFGAASDVIGQFKSTLDVGGDLTGFFTDQANAARTAATASKEVASAGVGVRNAQLAAAGAQRDLNAALATSADNSDQAERRDAKVADQQDRLAKANDAVTAALGRQSEAQSRLSDARPSGGGALGFLQSQLVEAQKFQASISKLLEAGIDPAVVQSLADAGPKASAAAVAGVLAEVRAGHKAAVNATVESLRNAQEAVKGQSLAFFTAQVAEASKFRDNLKVLADAKLDPDLLRKLAIAGPEAGAGAAAAFVADLRAGNLTKINATQADLRKLLLESTNIVEASTGPLNTDMEKLGSDVLSSLPSGMQKASDAVKVAVGKVVSDVVSGGIANAVTTLGPLLGGLLGGGPAGSTSTAHGSPPAIFPAPVKTGVGTEFNAPIGPSVTSHSTVNAPVTINTNQDPTAIAGELERRQARASARAI